MKIIYRLTLLLLVSTMVLSSQERSSKEYIEAIKRQENVLEKLRKEIQENEKKMEELSKQETDVLSEIHHLEKKIDLTDRLIAELETDITRRQKELSGLEGKIGDVKGDLADVREAFHLRLREFYKRRNVHPMEIVFGSATFSTALRRLHYMILIAGEDRRRIAEYTSLTRELGEAREERSRKLVEIAARRDEIKKEKSALLKAERKKETLHASVKKQKVEREKAIKSLIEETKRLTSLIGSLEKKRLMAVERERRGMYDLDKAIGLLRWPVEGEIIAGFGSNYNSDLKTQIVSNGIDILAEKGTSVRAVAPGRVEFSDWWQSYGKMVVVSHSNGYYSLYAHLARVLIQVGRDVKEGDIIGEVGDTGSLRGPYLHFEIRKGREAVNPLTYLRKK